MRLVSVALVAGALLAAGSGNCAAEDRVVSCKNHYILDDPCPPEQGGATVRIAKVYSTLDATVQGVELEVLGVGPPMLAGRTMTARDRHGNVRSFALGEPLFRGRARLLVMGMAWGDPVMTSDPWYGPFADLAMPRGFLAIDGGVISIDGMDEVAYGPLPADGWHALARDGSVVPARFGEWGLLDYETSVVTEFHNAELDHYFMTGRADEVAALKSGAVPGWQPTGKMLYVASRTLGKGYYPVCRYMLKHAAGYTHFFSAWQEECDALAENPDAVLETASAFYAGLPSDGVCATQGPVPGNGYGVIGGPIYRLWNGKPDTNHRFVADKAERDAMIARGWIAEGAGLDGVALCGWTVELPD